MSERNWLIFVNDIIECCDKISKFITGFDFEAFFSDEKTHDAVLRNLITIGEASKNIPNNIRQKYPVIEWRKIISLRNIIIHVYYKLDVNIIWDLVTNKIPELKIQIQKIINEN